MNFLNTLLENSSLPWLSALILGLMTAISPCPLATNITAVGFISKDITNRHRVFINGLIYTLGRAISYTILGVLLFLGASQIKISLLFQGYGEKLLGPVLVIIGLFMLDVIPLKLPGFSKLTDKIGARSHQNRWSALLLGMLFALAFCPYSGVLFFGLLIPLTITSASGLYLPVVFAVGTGLPVILFSWLLAYAVGNVGQLYHKLKTFELWFRRSMAVLFMIVGAYYIIRIYY